jgi:hypothetical protein
MARYATVSCYRLGPTAGDGTAASCIRQHASAIDTTVCTGVDAWSWGIIIGLGVRTSSLVLTAFDIDLIPESISSGEHPRDHPQGHQKRRACWKSGPNCTNSGRDVFLMFFLALMDFTGRKSDSFPVNQDFPLPHEL